jgi:hypothetical protein
MNGMRFVYEDKNTICACWNLCCHYLLPGKPRTIIVAAMSAQARTGLQLFTEEYVGTIHHIQKTSDHLYGGHSAVCKCGDRYNPEFSSQSIVQMSWQAKQKVPIHSQKHRMPVYTCSSCLKTRGWRKDPADSKSSGRWQGTWLDYFRDNCGHYPPDWCVHTTQLATLCQDQCFSLRCILACQLVN